MNSAAVVTPSLASCFQLDATLDVAALRDAFREKNRLLIPRILRAVDARVLHDDLSKQAHWGFIFSGRKGERWTVPAEECHSFSAVQAREVIDTAYRHGGTNSAHLFCTRGISKLSNPTRLMQFADFLNSPSFLEFIRHVTSVDRIRRIVTTVSCYRPGHFYAFHLDVARDHEGEQVGSIVFNLTPAWQAQWGGLLQFTGPSADIEDTFFHRFNSLSVFLVDQKHAVSFVAPFAARNRYTVSGKLVV